MVKRIFLILLLTFSTVVNSAEEVRSVIFGSMERILSDREGKPFILIFWSLECRYCPIELKMPSKLKRQNTDKLDIVLVATDKEDNAPQLISSVENYELYEAEKWVFANSISERLRFEVDKKWYGEVLRIHFYDQTHKRIVRTGLVDQDFMES